MKYFRLFSDLHNEMRGDKPFEIPHMDTDKDTVLILAGDIHVKDGVFRHDWLVNLSKRFYSIIYVLGNHDHWRSSIDLTEDKLRAKIWDLNLDNVKLMDQHVYFVDDTDWVIYAGTMWTDYNKGDPITMWNAKQVMNDFKYIRKDNYVKRVSPETLGTKHVSFKMGLKYFCKKHPANKIIVVTHHAPHQLSIADEYVDQYHDNGCYASDVSELILDHPNIKYWLHGHIHQPKNYMIGDCNVISNPIGYPNQDTGYEPFFIKELV